MSSPLQYLLQRQAYVVSTNQYLDLSDIGPGGEGPRLRETIPDGCYDSGVGLVSNDQDGLTNIVNSLVTENGGPLPTS